MYLNESYIAAFLALDLDSQQDQQGFQSNDIQSFEVKPPLLFPPSPTCSVLLAETRFAFSYGKPFVSDYVPNLRKCGDSWSFVILNLYGNITGRQFDRVGSVWMGAAPLLRYTNPEPSGSPITSWAVEKDVTEYSEIFKSNQTVVVSLDNVVDQLYTGIFNITVTLDFYAGTPPNTVADTVIPLSKSKNFYGWFTLPEEQSGTPMTLPPTVNRAEVVAYISPHSKDEFYYSNIYDNLSTGQYDGGPFKEIQLLLDGNIIGVDWPFPTIYTGGINPLLWRPIVAIGAFDVPEIRFDITPFLSLFDDGKPHLLSFNISPTANPFWFVDGNLKIFTGKKGKGRIEKLYNTVSIPKITISGKIEEVLKVDVKVQSRFEASGITYHSDGKWTRTEVRKALDYQSLNILRANGNNQTTKQITKIFSRKTVTNGRGAFSRSSMMEVDKRAYPLFIDLNVTDYGNGTFNFDTYVDHGIEISKGFVKFGGGTPALVSELKTRQIGGGNFGNTGLRSIAFQNQTYSFRSPNQCYKRNVGSYDREIVYDSYPSC